MQAAIFPPMLWAQRSDLILLTVSVQDATDVRIQLVHEGKALHFSCSTPDGKTYAANLDFFKAVLPEESHHVVRPRQIELKLKKAVATGESADGESWPRLTLDRTKNNNIQVDWSKWQDSDAEVEDEELGNFGLGGDEGGEGGDGGYSDLLNKFMQQQGRAEAAQHAGVGMDEVPAFGAAQGQTALTEEELRAGERRELDDDDDMPPLEEM